MTGNQYPAAYNLLTPAACRQARRLLGWSTVRLSAQGGVSTTTMRRIEAGMPVGLGMRKAVLIALLGAGIEFGSDVDGSAVRLRPM